MTAVDPTDPTDATDPTAALEQVVRTRRTVRSYDPDRPVTASELTRVLDAGLRTPSAGHTQTVELLALTTDEQRHQYWELTTDPDRAADAWLRGMRGAPALVLVWTSEPAYRDRYAEPDKGWPRDSAAWSAPYWWVDAGMAVQTMLLTATALGLGSAFVGVPRSAQASVAQGFAVPADRSSVGLVALGHRPAGQTTSAPRRPTRPRSERIHTGRWGRAQ